MALPVEPEARLSKPDTKKGRLQRAVLALLLQHEENGELPTNVRFLFYELEGTGVVRKGFKRGERNDGQNVSDALTHLREVGLVPWDWIADESRTLNVWRYASTVAEFVTDMVSRARIDVWGGELPLLLLVESNSLGGVLRSHASAYLVPLASTRGHVGGFLHTEIVPILQENERPVLYVGDLDLQGGQIEANTRAVLEREAGERPWTRIAITQEQVDERHLEPIVKTDRRYNPPRTLTAWETEALGQSTVTALVRDALDELLPVPLDDVRVRERAEKRATLFALARLADEEGAR